MSLIVDCLVVLKGSSNRNLFSLCYCRRPKTRISLYKHIDRALNLYFNCILVQLHHVTTSSFSNLACISLDKFVLLIAFDW